LCDLLRPYIEPLDDEAARSKRRRLIRDRDNDDVTGSEDDVSDEDPFVMYKAKGFGKIRLLLKAEGIHKRPRRF
jgi:hypothetical protein